jgi:hypothetical protein
VQGAVRTPEELAQRVRQYADAGFTDVVIDPTIPDLTQVDRLADAVL